MKINSTPYATYQHEIEKIIKDRQKSWEGEIATKSLKELSSDETFRILFFNSDGSRNYDVIHRDEGRKNRNFAQRISLIPTFLITAIAYPFQYVAFGRAGWSEDTKIGRFILKHSGFLNTRYESRSEQPELFIHRIESITVNSDRWDIQNLSWEELNGSQVVHLMSNGFNGFGHYKMKGYSPAKTDEKFYHRLNLFWATPAMCIYYGVRYICVGNKPITEDNKFANFIFRACNIQTRSKRKRDI